MPIVSDLKVRINGKLLDEQQLLVLCRAEVELGVHQQGMLHMELAAGQDASGDWAREISHAMIPGSCFSVDINTGSSSVRLINGLLTQSRLNFSADIHDSRFEVTGMDVLEKVKRNNHYQKYKGDLLNIVRQLLPHDIPLSPATPGVAKPITESQSGSDLDFLAGLAAKFDREIYVESSESGDTAYFQKLDFDNSKPPIGTDLRVNVGSQTNVRNAQFHFDLSGPTRVEANNLDVHGKAAQQKICSDLRKIPTLSQIEKDILGPPDFAVVQRLNKESQNTPADLRTRCDSELEKFAWVVVGNGELDTAAYGDLLYPRRTVTVRGAGSLFEGQYMVWKVTHTFSRDSHCQKFEVRRKLGVSNGGELKNCTAR